MPSSPRIAILETGSPAAPLRQAHGGYGDMFIEAFAPFASFSWTVLDPYLTNQFPPHENYDGYLITGSPFGVYEDHAFIPGLEEFIRIGIKKSVPMVGICFGHQVMAMAVGAQVQKSRKGWGVGVHRYTLGPDAVEFFGPIPSEKSLRCIVSHQDQVLSIPDDVRCLGGSEFCPNGILQYGDGPALSFQMHPEFTNAFSLELLNSRRDKIGPNRVAEAVESFEGPSDKDTILKAIVQIFSNNEAG